MEQIYCSVNEIVEDLGETGLSEARILSKITAASQMILRSLGQWLPVIDTKTLPSLTDENPESRDRTRLQTPPLLKITQVSVYDVVRDAGDYAGWPYNRCWPKGPYSALQLDQDGGLMEWAYEAGDNEIEGWWGRYDEAIDTLTGIDSQNATEVALVVYDGSRISPGMVVKIEDEWEFVYATGAPIDSTVTVSTDPGADLEEITVSNGSLLNVGELIRIDFELLRILDLAGNVILTARGVNGTKRAAHAAGNSLDVYRQFYATRGVNGSKDVDHSSAQVYRQVPPADVNYLCRQIAALMIKKSQTGYVGRAGNDDTGTGFFVNEFPKNQIEAVKQNYFWGGI